jgi:hypothetical protein
MLRLFASFALLFQLIAGALPAGSVVHVERGGAVVVSQSCCGMERSGPDTGLVHADSRTVECCCYLGVLIGHSDIVAAPPPAVALPDALLGTIAWVEPALERSPAPTVRVPARDHPPPPLGLARPLTIVIRC